MRPETKAAAQFIDSLSEETRVYLIDMVYRVAGVDPPPPPTEKGILRAVSRRSTTVHGDWANVIDLAQRRAGGES